MSGERSPRDFLPIKRANDPSNALPLYKDDLVLSPRAPSSTPNSVHSPMSPESARSSHVETLQYIFPFYHRTTLEATLDECKDNLLQSVLRISQEVLSFPAPFDERDNMSKLRHRITLFTSSIDRSDSQRPDCCSSPYCPRQMAYDWAHQRQQLDPDLQERQSPDYSEQVTSDLVRLYRLKGVKRHQSLDIINQTTKDIDNHNNNDEFPRFPSSKRLRRDLDYAKIADSRNGFYDDVGSQWPRFSTEYR